MTNRRTLAAIAGVALPLVAAFSLHSTGVCACASVAQYAVSFRWADADPGTLREIVERRYVKGALEADLAAQLGPRAYEKYCKPLEQKRATACLLPHDRNFWRTRGVEITFAWDSGRALSSVTAVPRIKYVWD